MGNSGIQAGQQAGDLSGNQTGQETYVPLKTAPQWFLDNIRQQGKSNFVTVEGRRVHYKTWNMANDSLPGLLFVHGFGGSTYWWSFLIPFFTDRYRVVAVDMPGMGESEHLEEYTDDCFARGILGVVRECDSGPLTIVGHSYGGIQSMYAMTLAPELFSHGIIMDCNLWFPQKKMPGLERPILPHRRRATRKECMDRFSLTPPQPESIDYLMDFVSYHACTRDDDGWHWKFDPMTRTANMIADEHLLTRIQIPVDCIFGELSYYNKDDLDETVSRVFPQLDRLIRVPASYHHLAMDHPLELVDALNELLDSRRG